MKALNILIFLLFDYCVCWLMSLWIFSHQSDTKITWSAMIHEWQELGYPWILAHVFYLLSLLIIIKKVYKKFKKEKELHRFL